MEAVFLKLVNMSITASWLVLAVIAVRLVFRKAPKWLLCLLWGLVALRLICPFSMESVFSLVPSTEPLPQEIIYTAHPEIQSGVTVIDNAVNPVLESSMTPVELTSANPTQIWSFVLSQIWILGMVLMLLYMLVSFLVLKCKLAAAIPAGRGIKQSEFVDSPFVLGLIRPVIYLPFGIAEDDLTYVLAHEKAHIRRRDHWWKPIGFLLLSVYWFNPVMWAAYILLCRDIEAACDEKVIKDMERNERRAYSTALLNCSIHRGRIAACPLAFGETGVKTRVKSVMNYKKPAFWVVLIAFVVCVVISVCFLTDPSEMYLYEIDDSRNYSDLFTNTDNITLIQEGEEYPVYDTEGLLELLDEVKVRKLTVNRSRSEDRDKTNQIHLRGNTYLNFSWDCSRVWIDNGVKPTYTYHVINTSKVREIFDTLWDVNLKITAANVTPEGVTVVYSPDGAYTKTDAVFTDGYWLEVYDGTKWTEMPSESAIDGRISTRITEDRDIHELEWRTLYGTLSPGTYRIGAEFYFRSVHIVRNLYAEFTIEDAQHVSVTDAPSVQISQLPDGYDYKFDMDQNLVFAQGSNVVGGVTVYPIPEDIYDPYDELFIWLEEMGIPDFEDTSLCYIGGMTSGDNGWVAEFASDVPNEADRTVHRRHTFKVVGDALYDIWFDMIHISYDTSYEIYDAIQLPKAELTDAEEETDEDIAFAKCLSVMDAVANGSCHILSLQQNEGNEGPSGYARTFLYHDGDFLYTNRILTEGENITEAGEYYNRYALLIVGEDWFSNEGHQGESGAIIWERTESAEPTAPWLGNHVWVKSFVSYMDTMKDAAGNTVYMWRYDKMYEDQEGFADHYFVNFIFDSDGNFINVTIQVNLFMENAFTVTESIVSLEPETVNAEIQKEYQRAIG